MHVRTQEEIVIFYIPGNNLLSKIKGSFRSEKKLRICQHK